MTARALIAPSRYVQGENALAELGEHLARLGTVPLLVAGDRTWDLVGRTVTRSLGEAGLPVARATFRGYTTAATIDDLVRRIREGGVDVVVGLGGGSCIDAVKAAGHLAAIRWASVPTIASTDAPCSALSVVYHEDGSFAEYRFFPHNPDLVLVDSAVVAQAPLRFLVGGIGDALATWPEADAVARSGRPTMAGGLPTASSGALARLCWDMLHEHALDAIDALRTHEVTPGLEKVIEANTLLSGLGFESGGLAAAHAVHNGLTAVPHTHGLTHGEKVNVGTMTQFVLDHRHDDEIADLVEFTTRVGLPNTLTEVGLGDADDDVLRAVARAATAEGETIHNMPFAVTADDVVAALRQVEAQARSIRSATGLPEPVSMVAPR